MRLLVIVLLVLLFLAMAGFVVTNLDKRVDLTIWATTYSDLALYIIVLATLLVGIAVAGVVAVAEGVSTRLENRRLSREIRKLETEINYLRTQPPGASRQEPDELPSSKSLPPAEGVRRGGEDSPASAPIYDPGSGEWDPDDDDDIYSGGRAV
jgi:uncharacterized integral membrane protein